MKKLNLLLLSGLIVSLPLFSAELTDLNALDVSISTLDNGLTVYLNEDHFQPDIFFSLVVRAGSANDPVNATGVAHYFEHMMFKGTDSIGALNYKDEKHLLDSIEVLYDSLAMVSSVRDRQKIEAEIAALSVRASKLSLPMEFSELLETLGCYAVNAFTSYDYTYYQCRVPEGALPEVLKVYAEQFRNPVFRDFQTELETVYDEKNSYIEMPFYDFFDHYRSKLFKETPYENSIIGKTKHLKTPSVSKLKAFFNTYYVANNMAVLLSGNFNNSNTEKAISRLFSVLKSGEVPDRPAIKLTKFNGIETPTVVRTPVSTLLVSYETVADHHPDKHISDLCSYFLLNDNQTGTLDNLAGNGLFNSISKTNIGGNLCPHVSYIAVGGNRILNLKLLSEYFFKAIDRVTDGDFEDKDLDYAKYNYAQDRQLAMESVEGRIGEMINNFVYHLTWENLEDRVAKIEKVTREDVIRVAKQQYGKNYYAIWSRAGYNGKIKVSKPEWITDLDKNTGRHSLFGEHILKDTVILDDPGIIEFGKDVYIDTLGKGYNLYTSKNPYNAIYTLKIIYHYGSFNDKLLHASALYMSIIGTELRPIHALMQSFRDAHAVNRFECTPNALTITLTGDEKYLGKAIKLLGEKMLKPKGNYDQVKLILNAYDYDRRVNAEDPYYLSYSLLEGIRCGDSAITKWDLPLDVLRAKKPKHFEASFKEAMNYEADFVFIGNTPVDSLKKLLMSYIGINREPKAQTFRVPAMVPRTSSSVFTAKKSKSTQNSVFLLTKGGTIDDGKERATAECFRSYFGDGTSALTNEYLRVKKPLAYAHFTALTLPLHNGEASSIFTIVSNQADKSMMVLQTLDRLYTEMPDDSAKLALARVHAVNELRSSVGSFRNKAEKVAYWKWIGYSEDPRKDIMANLPWITKADILAFYNEHVAQGIKTYGVVGNLNYTRKRDLEPFGRINRLKLSQIVLQ